VWTLFMWLFGKLRIIFSKYKNETGTVMEAISDSIIDNTGLRGCLDSLTDKEWNNCPGLVLFYAFVVAKISAAFSLNSWTLTSVKFYWTIFSNWWRIFSLFDSLDCNN